MTPDTSPTDRCIESTPITISVRYLLVGIVVLTLTAHPVAAQGGTNNPVCNKEGMQQIATVISGFVKLSAGLGVMGLVAVWQGDALMEMFSAKKDQKKRIKEHKRTAMKSSATLIMAGPIATIGGTLMNIPVASCVDLIPF